MPRNLRLKRGLRLPALIAGVIGCLLGDWQAIAADLSPSQIVALRFPDLSPSQIVALRFPDISPSQIVALRFLQGSEQVSEQAPEQAPEAGAALAATPTAAAALAAPEPLTHLIDFQVSAALPPIGHSRFCLQYPDDCEIHGIDFRHRKITLTLQRWRELNSINREVNRNIVPEITPGNGATEKWIISPSAGDCKDYAITKRHELLARGWPSRALLLSEVGLPSGEHHLLLVVRVKDGDLVLDNLNDDIRLAAMTYDQYRWTRIQSPQNPRFWMRVQTQDAVHTAMLSN
jgi:predicted transglutaminase-like cysteine proteinase